MPKVHSTGWRLRKSEGSPNVVLIGDAKGRVTIGVRSENPAVNRKDAYGRLTPLEARRMAAALLKLAEGKPGSV